MVKTKRKQAVKASQDQASQSKIFLARSYFGVFGVFGGGAGVGGGVPTPL